MLHLHTLYVHIETMKRNPVDNYGHDVIPGSSAAGSDFGIPL
ncbi:MAG: hypothetical protein QG589_21 [Patescibacteria group bacterium]|nr:hypothetical protein [Patescibacteria group bacterium]